MKRSILIRIKKTASINSATAIGALGSIRIYALALSFPTVIKCQYPKQNIPAKMMKRIFAKSLLEILNFDQPGFIVCTSPLGPQDLLSIIYFVCV
jgi:hypothetical protein